MARPNFGQPVCYVIRDIRTCQYLRISGTWRYLHPLKTKLFTSYSGARKALLEVRKGKRWPGDYQIADVQLCRL